MGLCFKCDPGPEYSLWPSVLQGIDSNHFFHPHTSNSISTSLIFRTQTLSASLWKSVSPTCYLFVAFLHTYVKQLITPYFPKQNGSLYSFILPHSSCLRLRNGRLPFQGRVAVLPGLWLLTSWLVDFFCIFSFSFHQILSSPTNICRPIFLKKQQTKLI